MARVWAYNTGIELVELSFIL